MNEDLASDEFVGPPLPEPECFQDWPNPFLHGITRWMLCTPEGLYRNATSRSFGETSREVLQPVDDAIGAGVKAGQDVVAGVDWFRVGLGVGVSALAVGAVAVLVINPAAPIQIGRALVS